VSSDEFTQTDAIITVGLIVAVVSSSQIHRFIRKLYTSLRTSHNSQGLQLYTTLLTKKTKQQNLHATFNYIENYAGPVPTYRPAVHLYNLY